MRDSFLQAYGKYIGEKRLLLGCALSAEPGWVNVDITPHPCVDVVWDLEKTPLPFEDNSFDTVLATHVFEHITNLVPLVLDVRRILKPGGHLVAVTPYGSSDDAWDCPHHVRMFTERTWFYFDKGLYEFKEHSGYGATQGFTFGKFPCVEIAMVPYPEFIDDPEIEFKKRHWRNVIQEVHAVLRKVGD